MAPYMPACKRLTRLVQKDCCKVIAISGDVASIATPSFEFLLDSKDAISMTGGLVLMLLMWFLQAVEEACAHQISVCLIKRSKLLAPSF